MKKAVFLVTAISGDLSNGILKILAENGFPVYGTDIYEFPVGMDKVIEWKRICRASDSRYLREIAEICRDWGITHVVPGNEAELSVISSNRKIFESMNVKLLVNNQRIIDTFLDKYRTYEALKGIAGINIPCTYTYDGFVPDGKIYIAKLRKSSGSKFAEIIKDKTDLDLERLKVCKDDLIIQEYIDAPDDEYTVGVFCDGSSVRTVIFKRRLKHGYTDFVELVCDKGIESTADIIARKFGLKGYLNIQLRKYKGENYIFEINPRVSGSVYFRHMVGFDDVLWWTDMLDGRKAGDYEMKYSRTVAMRELVEKFVIRE